MKVAGSVEGRGRRRGRDEPWVEVIPQPSTVGVENRLGNSDPVKSVEKGGQVSTFRDPCQRGNESLDHIVPSTVPDSRESVQSTMSQLSSEVRWGRLKFRWDL